MIPPGEQRTLLRAQRSKRGAQGHAERLMILSVYNVLEQMAGQLQADLRALLEASGLVDRSDRSGGFVVIITATPFEWVDLPDTARPFQNRLRDHYREFASLVDVVLADQPESLRKGVAEGHVNFLSVVNQDEPTQYGTVDQHERDSLATLGAALRYVRTRVTADQDGAILVPDTNALYARPALDEWQYSDCPRFSLALVSAVVGELDRHKDDHSNPVVREKAQRLVRQVGEYRRRGSLAEGVTLRADRSRIFSWAREPQMDKALPWLDRSCADDRLLASAMEIARARALTPVAIVTRDLNLQNKCELARFPFLWPPE